MTSLYLSSPSTSSTVQIQRCFPTLSQWLPLHLSALHSSDPCPCNHLHSDTVVLNFKLLSTPTACVPPFWGRAYNAVLTKLISPTCLADPDRPNIHIHSFTPSVRARLLSAVLSLSKWLKYEKTTDSKVLTTTPNSESVINEYTCTTPEGNAHWRGTAISYGVQDSAVVWYLGSPSCWNGTQQRRLFLRSDCKRYACVHLPICRTFRGFYCCSAWVN
jgi:hypothetical protein